MQYSENVAEDKNTNVKAIMASVDHELRILPFVPSSELTHSLSVLMANARRETLSAACG